MKQMTLGAAAALGIALVCLSCAAPEEPAPAEPEAPVSMSAREAMQDIVHRWDEAERSGEVDRVIALYAPTGAAAMPPDLPAAEGAEALRAFLTEQLAEGGLVVSNSMSDVLSSGDLVIGRGTYSRTTKDASDQEYEESGKWLAVTRQQADGKLLVVRNIWNRDAPPPGATAPAPAAASGPAAAEEAACIGGPRALDEAFVIHLKAGNVPELVALHAEDGSRLPPGMPAVDGRAAVAGYVQSRVDMFVKRDLELTDIQETVQGDLGYTRGRFRFDYSPAAGGPSATGAGKYLAVSEKGSDGCWRFRWVLWNSDSPWPTA